MPWQAPVLVRVFACKAQAPLHTPPRSAVQSWWRTRPCASTPWVACQARRVARRDQEDQDQDQDQEDRSTGHAALRPCTPLPHPARGRGAVRGPCLRSGTPLLHLPGPYIKWFLEKLGHDGLNRMLGAGAGGARMRVHTMRLLEDENLLPLTRAACALTPSTVSILLLSSAGFEDKTAYAQCIFAYTPSELRARAQHGPPIFCHASGLPGLPTKPATNQQLGPATAPMPRAPQPPPWHSHEQAAGPLARCAQ